MGALEIAVVSCDEDVRLEAARAFDAAPRSWSVRLHETVPSGVDVIVIGPDVDYAGRAIRFQPGRAENLLADIERSAVTRNRCVYVVGPCGGAGVTTVSLHLAASLAKRKPTCYLESVWGGAGVRLGFPNDHLTWSDIEPPDGAVETTALPAPGGFRALFAGAGRVVPREVLAEAQRCFEFVVVDAGGSHIDPPILDEGALAVMVVSPTRVGARRARAVLAAHPDLQWGLITNRTGPGGDLGRIELQDAIGHAVLDHLPFSPRLRRVEDDGGLLSRWSSWNRKIERLAAALIGA
jgi:hypothetical protein